MLRSVVPRPLDNLARVRLETGAASRQRLPKRACASSNAAAHLVLLYRCVVDHPDVVVNVKVEEGTRLSARLIDDEVVECVVLPGPPVAQASAP